MEGRLGLGSQRLGGYGEPMTGVILRQIAQIRGLDLKCPTERKQPGQSKIEDEAIRNLSEELRRVSRRPT